MRWGGGTHEEGWTGGGMQTAVICSGEDRNDKARARAERRGNNSKKLWRRKE